MNKKKFENTPSVEENPLFHDTWKLLKTIVMQYGIWNWLSNKYEIPLKSSTETALRNFLTPFILPGLTLAAPDWKTMQKALSEAT